MRDRTFPRHVHQWRELLPQIHERTTFVVCDLCVKNGRESMHYLSAKVTAEFRRQIKHGINPRFRGNALIANPKRTR